MLRRRLPMLAVLLALAFVLTGFAAAAPPEPTQNSSSEAPNLAPEDVALGVDVWTHFLWSGSGSPYNSEGNFVISSTVALRLKVTDLYCRGDRFMVYDNGVPLETTSASTVQSSCQTTIGDPDAAFDFPSFSHGNISLPAGNHKIRLQATQNYFGYGEGAIMLARQDAMGYVFFDADRDGVRDSGETTGPAGVGLKMRRNGLLIDWGKSGYANGWYEMYGGRRSGKYCIEIAVPAGYRLTTPFNFCRTFATSSFAPFRIDFGLTPGSEKKLFLPLLRR
jgi:hypothetical protein